MLTMARHTVSKSSKVRVMGEYTAGIYGHNNAVIRKAMDQALDGGWNYGGHSRFEHQLAKRLCDRFPSMEMVRFVNSGTEANVGSQFAQNWADL